MQRYETKAEKEDAIETLQLLMSHCHSDEAYRGYSGQLRRVISRPVAPDICAFGNCQNRVEGKRSYCEEHSSASWLGGTNE